MKKLFATWTQQQDYYLKAGFETTSDYAKATQRLFDAYVFMESAKRERDPEKQSKYSMAEKVLQNAAEYFEKAKYPDKAEQAQKLLQKVREEKKVGLVAERNLPCPRNNLLPRQVFQL